MASNTATGKRVDASPNFRFEVRVDNIQMALFSEIKLPTLSVETIDIKEGGQNEYVHKLPVRVDVGTVTLKHGITQDLYLLTWYMDIMSGDLQNALRTVTITLYATDHSQTLTLTLGNAYPIKWSGPSLEAEGNTVAIDEVEFAFREFTVG